MTLEIDWKPFLEEASAQYPIKLSAQWSSRADKSSEKPEKKEEER